MSNMISTVTVKGVVWFRITFPLVIWYSLLFNPVTDVELHENHCMIQLAVGFSRKGIDTEMKEGSA